MTALIIMAIIGAPLTLVLHEFSHCVAVWADGGEVIEFKPWPHKYDGRWRVGRMMGVGGDPWWFVYAPFGKASLLMFVYCTLNQTTSWPWFALFLWEMLDVLWWWRGWLVAPHTDGGKARELLRSGVN